jgi:accessory gene regulator protein AgrB
MTDLLYYMFYCSAGNDGTKSKHEMVAYGMEIVATQLLSFFTFIIVGALNIRISVILLWLLIIAANGFIAYFSNKWILHKIREV